MKKISLAAILLFITQLVFSQATAIKNLVFEGAGIRGIAYCGALQELENRQMMTGVQRVAGTSAGAVTALAVSLGYSGNEIEELIRKTDFKKFNEGGFLFMGGLHRLNKYFGWYRSKRVDKWLGEIIAKKTGNADITFEQMQEKGFKDLYVTGTCLNRQQLVIFSRSSYPFMKVRDAVRISMTIPFYFEAVLIDSSGIVFPASKNKKGLDVMVDGGLVGNYPMNIFDSTKERESTIGFRIDTDDQITSDGKDRSLAAMPVTNVQEYVKASYNMIIENLNRPQLTEGDWKRTVSISDGNVGPRIRKLSQNELDVLIGNGRKAMQFYLANHKN